jgi:tetratricopeptide (TPR) repeat protein
MRGHATAAEEAMVRALESRLDPATSSPASLLELALLYQEPCHEEDEAIELLEAILERDSNYSLAKIWLAYLHRHYSLDPASFKKARQLLQSVPDSDRALRAAALLLLAEIGQGLEDLSAPELISLLQASVALAPTWVANRNLLGWYLAEIGERDEAAAQIRAALGNIIPLDPAWPLAEREFEVSITGRAAHGIADRLASYLAGLGA